MSNQATVKEGGRRIENLSRFMDLFWEADVSHIDIDERKCYIIERILEYGDRPEVNWMLRSYAIEEIREVLASSRSLSLKSRAFWEKILAT